MSIPAPEHLGAAGKSLWGSVASRYDLRPDELSALEDACELSDMIGALTDAWVEDGKPMLTKGSMGQQVTHPLISEIRTHRMARAALLRGLKLPDEGGVGADASDAARRAAASRWSRGS